MVHWPTAAGTFIDEADSSRFMELFAELLGALAGDGFIGNYGVRKQQFMVQLTGHRLHDKEYFKYLERIIARYVPQKTIHYQVKGNTLRLIIYSRTLFLMFRDDWGFPVGKKADKLAIPPRIRLHDSTMRAFIRGLFDTDGCVFFDGRKHYRRPYPRLVLELTCHKLFKEVVGYLELYFRVRKCKRVRHGLFPISCLEIYGHAQLARWLEIIGFSNQKHITKCLCSSAVRPNPC